jgi:hypothetical protein
MKTYYATVQWGVGGYVAGTEVIQGASMEAIADAINLETDSLLRKVNNCLNDHGDLRYWCPQFAEGYPSGTGTLGDDVTVTITNIATELGQEILDYWSEDFKKLRKLVDGED